MNRMVVRVLTLATFLLSATAARAQNLVISNARIVVGNGSVIESGTLVVRNGRIASVGLSRAESRGAATAAPSGPAGLTAAASRSCPASSTAIATSSRATRING